MDAEVFSRLGSDGMIGMTSVCMSETTTPTVLSTAMSTAGETPRVSEVAGVTSAAVTDTNMHRTHHVYGAQFGFAVTHAT
ncbi:hypothetical protein GCM10011610_19780 [Nocardia rhizosphaerihabitans]|uniref:Uncharacterized protein n=1 Tax=Nocardia rhizosphaerihabitans TaxID=1691570 RepID=A0ABQ2K8B0_9NOCA|nr:hypothetical protein GCM10011610_19780 [Nocardia rhizosphaerihabitans]